MSKPPAKRRRLELSLDDKIKLIAESESLPKPTYKQLSEKYGVGKSTVSDIIKRKDMYVKNIEENSNGNKFRFSSVTKYEQLNDLMWNWFRQAREKFIPLSGPILQQKSLEFASQLNISDFKASNGWLDKFKSRHSIKAFKVSGESASVDVKIVEDYRQQIPEICEDYNPCDIFNCDETGLYFRALPDKMLAQKGASSKGVKNSKERLTVMFACSATGEKLTPLVIGKAKQPRCFRNLKSAKMPVTWDYNRKAWMDSYIFEKWIKSVDKMKRLNRKILMFLDNATSHTKDINLDNVTLKFLPANCTSHLQPLDQGIIRAFKGRYRSKMMKSLVTEIDCVDNVTELCKQISVLDALFWIRDAWNETRTETIQKCFALSGFLQPQKIDDKDDEDDDIPLHQLMRIARAADIDQDRLVSFDDDIPVEDNGDEWEQTLLELHKAKTDSAADDESEEETPTPSPSEPLLTLREITEFSRRLAQYAVCKDDRFLDISQNLRGLSEDITVRDQCSKRQATMDIFFVKH